MFAFLISVNPIQVSVNLSDKSSTKMWSQKKKNYTCQTLNKNQARNCTLEFSKIRKYIWTIF